MGAREEILAAVRVNAPRGDFPLPQPSAFPFDDGGSRIATFRNNLAAMGGHCRTGSIPETMSELFPDATQVVSTVPDYQGTRTITEQSDPRSLADVDIAITRAAFGVAETGSVLLLDDSLVCNAVAYLAQHLIVLLDSEAILLTLQEAYLRAEFHRHRYASFHTGPSATADIEGVLIYGAQGVRSLTVVLR